MAGVCLGIVKCLNQKEGLVVRLGKKRESAVDDYRSCPSFAPGRQYFLRPLKNAVFNRNHYAALTALRTKEVRASLLRTDGAGPAKVLLAAKSADWPEKAVVEQRAKDFPSTFNEQQRKALSLERATTNGVTLIQGPPGTGKSHLIVHGLLPEQLREKKRTLCRRSFVTKNC